MKPPSKLRDLLVMGDRRTIGHSNEVAELVLCQPRTAAQLVECLWDLDAGVRMRAADALEKLSRQNATLLQPFKTLLLSLSTEAVQKEVRWHLALIVPRLRLDHSECLHYADVLQTYLEDRSSIVRTFAMQGFADLTLQCPAIAPTLLEMLRKQAKAETPAMRARARILLRQVDSSDH